MRIPGAGLAAHQRCVERAGLRLAAHDYVSRVLPPDEPRWRLVVAQCTRCRQELVLSDDQIDLPDVPSLEMHVRRCRRLDHAPTLAQTVSFFTVKSRWF